MQQEEKIVLFEIMVDRYGMPAQEDQAIEEMAELIKAIIKYRKDKSDENGFDLIDEIADVKILIEQLELMHKISSLVEERIDFKLERQKKRMFPDLQ